MLETAPSYSRVIATIASLVSKGKLQLPEKNHQPEKQILRKEQTLETKKSQLEKEQMQEVPVNSEHQPFHFHQGE